MPKGTRRLHWATIIVAAIEHGRSIIGALFLFLIVRLTGKSDRDIGFELILAGIGCLAIIPATFKYLSVRYEIADDAFTLYSGILFKQQRIIPLERIQNISQKRNLLHRLLGVTVLKIETASGGHAEAELSVISIEDANHLALQLRRIDQVVPDKPEDKALFRAGLKDLFIAGATQNRAGVIIVFALGILNYVKDLIPILVKKVPTLAGAMANSAAMTAAIMAVGLVFLLVAGWLLSIITTVAGYYGFEVKRDEGVLRLRHGLFTQLQSTVPIRRIQSIRIIAPILQRLMGFCHVYAYSAASYEDKAAGGAAQLTPLIAEGESEKVVHVAFPFVRMGDLRWERVSPVLIRRSFLRYLIWTLILLGAVEATTGPLIFAALPIAGAAAWFFSAKRHTVLGYCRQAGAVFVRDGVWKRVVTILPEDRIQWVGLLQSPVQKRLGVCTLQLVSAAAGVPPLLITDMPIQAGRELQDQLVVYSDEHDPRALGGL